MELKILILDDEYIILDGLCSFPWEMYGCRIVGKAMDVMEEFLRTVCVPDRIHSDTQRDPPDFQKKSGGSLFSYFKICFTDMQYFDSQIPHFHL